jgi:hypothetical protein
LKKKKKIDFGVSIIKIIEKYWDFSLSVNFNKASSFFRFNRQQVNSQQKIEDRWSVLYVFAVELFLSNEHGFGPSALESRKSRDTMSLAVI